MDEVRLRCFLSSSKRNLFEVTKAISSPEKKAENSKVSNINESWFKTAKQNYESTNAKIQYFRKPVVLKDLFS